MAAKFEATADYNAVVRELDKVRREYAKLATELGKVKSAADKHESSTNKQAKANEKLSGTFGKIKSDVAGMVTGYFAVSTAVSAITDAMRFMRSETDAAVESLIKMRDEKRGISQIAGKGQLKQMESRADALAMKYGEDRQDMLRVLFSMQSTGTESAMESVAKYGDIVGVGAQSQVAGLAGPEGLFAGQVKPEALVSMGLVAAGSSVADFEKLLSKALPTVAEGGVRAGFTPSEMLGTMGVMAGQFATPDVAATRFRGLFTKMQKAGYSGMSGLQELAAMPDEQVFSTDVLGDSDEVRGALNAFRGKQQEVLQRVALVAAERANIAGGGQSAMETQYQERMSYDENVKMENYLKSQQIREVTRERELAGLGLEQQAKQNLVMSQMTQQQRFGISRWGAEKGAAVAESVGLGEEGTGAAMEVGAATVLGPALQVLEFFKRPKPGDTTNNAAALAGQQQR